eukprot:tig00000113_g5701.t1
MNGSSRHFNPPGSGMLSPHATASLSSGARAVTAGTVHPHPVLPDIPQPRSPGSYSPGPTDFWDTGRSGFTSPHNITSGRFAELGARITDLDSDIQKKRERQVARHYDRETVKGALGTVTQSVGDVASRLASLEERMGRGEAHAQAEKDRLESLESRVWKVMEERFKALLARSDQERVDREHNSLELRKRCAALEEQVGALRAALDEERRSTRGLEALLAKTNDRLAEVSSASNAERAKRDEEVAAQFRGVAANMANLTGAIDAERVARERDGEKVRGGLLRELDDVRRRVESDRKEALAARDALVAPLHAELRDLREALEHERRARDAALQAAASRAADQMAEVRGLVQRAERAARDEAAGRAKAAEDALAKAAFAAEREREVRDRLHRQPSALLHLLPAGAASVITPPPTAPPQVTEELAAERFAREQSDARLAELLDAALLKLKQGMEGLNAPPQAAGPPRSAPLSPAPMGMSTTGRFSSGGAAPPPPRTAGPASFGFSPR